MINIGANFILWLCRLVVFWKFQDQRFNLTRGGPSHFFRNRIRSCPKIFESGSGNFSNLGFRLPLIAWLESMTRVRIFGDSNSTRHKLKKMVTLLDSSHLFYRMTRLESQSLTRDSSQRHFYKISEFLKDKPSSFAHKEMRIFCFSDDQDWGKFFVLTVWLRYATF